MDFFVFAQLDEPRVPLPSLLQNAQRYFSLSINVLAESGVDTASPDSTGSRVLLEVQNPKRCYATRFEIRARSCTDADLAAAREAEARTQSAGMANLASRCASVWEITPAPNATELARFEFCAVLASTALGPVMPRDASSLFGVRGALERAVRATLLG